ncbi:uncharacterized protein LOC113557394 isoform X2 [Rhopalosiphum maidis]|uniref:uncharacterized protein LOC113557394 isoform X2 n=1 Tax=Rhopalosiphum maidis TaxID=43146 RepID=UPI000EFF7E32|nr:uncharacterized protein LOC113557394 isoform X2 [Rhopalosiphum maidis]
MTSIPTLIFYVAVVLVAFYINDRNSANIKLLELYEHNINISFGPLNLGNDSSCNALDFQLNYKKHADLGILFSNYASYISMVSLFKLWTSQRNDKIFFGTLKLNDKTVNAVAKGPGRNFFEMFEQTVNIATDIDTIITYGQWTLLPLSGDSRSLEICSKNIKLFQNSLLYSFFNSVISDDSDNKSHSLIEAWIAAHVSVELLVLKVLHGYRYVPNIYATCGRIYFVEDCGHTLQYHMSKMNLTNRLLVAKELLTLALELADGTAHQNYSFYLTDLTADNIAVQLDKTSGLLQSLKVIDWSDVIIVVNNHSMKKTDDEMIHVSKHIDCGVGCLAYSKEDICQSRLSDHNVYAVCKEFLSSDGRLLHEITNLDKTIKSPEKEVKNLASLLNNCLWNFDVEKQSEINRLDTAKLIIKSIQQIYDFETSDITNNGY